MNVIEIKSLKKFYGRSRGVIDANFELRNREILGFVGPNGAGKSTVIRILMGLINKDEGNVTILGENPSCNINKKIGYLPSEVYMYMELTVLQQLKYIAKIRNCDEQRIYELAEELDLDLTRRIKELSFGNKKKVGIVAALMHEPEVIILDEPTSGLDPLIQQKFFNLLLKARQKGASIILSSHVLNEVEKICDRVTLIKEGKVLFTNTLDELKQSQYKKVFVTPAINDIKLQGLELLSEKTKQAVYSYHGDINILLDKFSKQKLDNFSVVDLDLEEIFMHYYQKEQNDA